MCAIGEGEESFWPYMMKFLDEQHMPHQRFLCSGANSQNYFLPGWLDQCRVRDWRYESYVQGGFKPLTRCWACSYVMPIKINANFHPFSRCLMIDHE